MMENTILKGNRVDCLYRVSTDKQVDYNDKSQADIPMQRRECHRFCEKMGDRKSTRLNSSHPTTSRMPSSA